MDLENLNIALIHYWLQSIRGGEQVLLSLADLYPKSDIFSLFADPAIRTRFSNKITTSGLDKIPGMRRLHRFLLPFYPAALEQFDLSQYDLVISSESGPAKGVITRPETCHICYCHSPMRYAWNMYHEYWRTAPPWTRLFMLMSMGSIRRWDLATASRVDYFLANSQNVRRRIQKYYRRDALVIHPPVNVDQFQPVPDGEREDYYFILSELVPYKRLDLAVDVFNRSQRRLIVGGSGSELNKLRQLAGPNITFLGHVSQERLPRLYARARALIFPGEEDFGITPLEAMASGTPVIGYGRGGITETVIDGQTGIFFKEQSRAGLAQALDQFEKEGVNGSVEDMRTRAMEFSLPRFQLKLSKTIEILYSNYQNGIPHQDQNKLTELIHP